MDDVIIQDFAFAWKALNAEFIIKHLADEFKYDSQWVYDSLDKDAYADYLRGKFSYLKSQGIYVPVEIVPDYRCGTQMLKIIDPDGTICYYRIEVKDGKVIKGDICMF